MLGSAEFSRCILKTFFPFVVTMAVFLHRVHPRFLSEATGRAEYQSAYKQLGGVSRVMAFVWERACSWGAHTHIQNNFLSSIMKRYYGKSICLWLVFFLSLDAGIHSFCSMFHYSFLIAIADTRTVARCNCFCHKSQKLVGVGVCRASSVAVFADLDKPVSCCSRYTQSFRWRAHVETCTC